MQIDFYTKLVFTVIAGCLLAVAVRGSPWVESVDAQPSISCSTPLTAGPYRGIVANVGGYKILVTCR